MNNNQTNFKTNTNSIELIITYKCNRSCYNCQAMVRQAPSDESMTIKQIKKFIQESINLGIQWNTIRIIGGEPTLHSHIKEIMQLICEYKITYSPKTRIILVTNGYGKTVNNLIDYLSNTYDIYVENSHKVSDYHAFFTEINNAPVDLAEYNKKDFSKGCWITSLCGIALDMHGFYSCATAAAIDRVYGLDKGFKQLSMAIKTINKQKEIFCGVCGHFLNDINNIIDFDIISDDDFIKLNKIISKKLEQMEDNKTLYDYDIKKEEYNPIVSDTWFQSLANYSINKPILTEY